MSDDDVLQAVREALSGGRHEEALRAARQVAAARPESGRLAEAHRLALQAAFYLGKREAARRHGLEGLRLAYETGGPLARSRAHNDLAVVLGAHGLSEEALDHLWKSVHATEEAGAEVEGGPLNNLGNIYVELGRFDEAVALFDRAAGRFARTGDEAGWALARANVGRTQALAGRAALAIPALDEALRTFERLERPDDLVATYAKLGMAHGAAGAPYHARRAFTRALALHERGHALRLLPETRMGYGEWALEQGEVDTALAQLEAAAEGFEAADELARSGVLEPLSRALEARGRVQEALAALRRHLASTTDRQRATDRAATRLRMLELELGIHGDQEIARLRTVELTRANATLRRETERLEELSTTDALTGLRNRRALETRLRDEVAVAVAKGLPLVLALVDLDRFKDINDTFSHEVGDRVLRRVAELLTKNVRATDVAARWGGEEFALLLPNTRPADASRLLDRVCAAIAEADWRHVREGMRVTTSIGAAALDEASDVVDLLRLADRRLYAAKAEGRDRTVVSG